MFRRYHPHQYIPQAMATLVTKTCLNLLDPHLIFQENPSREFRSRLGNYGQEFSLNVRRWSGKHLVPEALPKSKKTPERRTSAEVALHCRSPDGFDSSRPQNLRRTARNVLRGDREQIDGNSVPPAEKPSFLGFPELNYINVFCIPLDKFVLH